MKKLTALLLALVMVLAIGSTALAGDPGTDPDTGSSTTTTLPANTIGDVYKDDSKTTTTGNNIPLNKSIVFFNLNNSKVYEPNIIYSYAVAPFAEENQGKPLAATVTDDGEHNDDVPVTVTVNNGIAGGVRNTTIIFSSDNALVTAAEKGAEFERSANMAVDLSKFTHAGIYRYVITESSSPAPESVGMDARTSDYSNVRYLDVYIKNSAAGTGLELSGAVIFKTDAKDTSTIPNNATDAITTTTDKTTGFEPGVNTDPDGDGKIDYTADKTVDRYTTYDFTVTKEITGAFADKTNEFPFYVNVENSIANAAFTYTKDDTESFHNATADGEKVTLGNAAFTIGEDAKTSSLALKNGESIKLVGVPSNQTDALTVGVKEFNNTEDKYTASAKAKNAAGADIDLVLTDTDLVKDDTAALTPVFGVKANDTKAQTIKITNKMADISETGVVLRFAPYALMLGAGVALFIILKVRKNKAVEEA